MDSKAEAIVKKLSEALENCRVDYHFANDLHKFCLAWGPTHWLYVAAKFIDERTPRELADSVHHSRIADLFQGSQQSRWLLLSENGIREVDSNFGGWRSIY